MLPRSTLRGRSGELEMADGQLRLTKRGVFGSQQKALPLGAISSLNLQSKSNFKALVAAITLAVLAIALFATGDAAGAGFGGMFLLFALGAGAVYWLTKSVVIEAKTGTDSISFPCPWGQREDAKAFIARINAEMARMHGR